MTSKPQKRQTYELPAHEYAFWLLGMFWSGIVLGLIFGGWIC